MRYWLSRLAFALFILAGFLAWEGYRGMTDRPPVSPWQTALLFIGALASFMLALAGLRERHRPTRGDEEEG